MKRRKPLSKQTVMWIRIGEELVKAIDAHAQQMAATIPWFTATRSAAVRDILSSWAERRK